MPDAPVTVDLSLSELWPAIRASGFTEGSAVYNGDYILVAGLHGGKPQWALPGTGIAIQFNSAFFEWEFTGGPDEVYQTEAGTEEGQLDYPYQSPTWSGSGSGMPVLTRALAPPLVIAPEGEEPTVNASLAWSGGVGSTLVLTAVAPGRLGNEIRVRGVNPGTNNAALSVVVTGHDIQVNLATNGSAAATSTANQVKAALQASAAATALITVSGSGTAVLPAFAWTALYGGTGGLPPRPVTIDP